MGEIADASAQREEHAGKREAPAQDYSKHISSSIDTVIGHLQQDGSGQGLCGCSCCTIHLATGTFWVVVAISSDHATFLGAGRFLWGALEGLGVPLGGSRGPGSASGGLCGACGCKIR